VLEFIQFQLKKSVTKEEVQPILQFIQIHHKELVAIGECGLDFSPFAVSTPQQKEDQRFVLAEQIKLAKEYELPLNVHSRSAGRPTIDCLKENGAKNVLLHAFDGSAKVVRVGIECGYHFSIPTSVVRQPQTQQLVELVPLDKMLLESDSPALHPIKGPNLRNEPKNLEISLKEVARIKKISIEAVATITTANAKRLFPKFAKTNTTS